MRKARIIEVYLPGCNLKCEFCIAPYLTDLGEIRGIQWIEASDLVRAASGAIDVLLFSGGEASIHDDYVTDVFSKCQDQKIKTCLETNGYMTKKTAQKLAPHTDYVAVGLKASLDQAFYRRRLGVKETEPIFETMKIFAEHGCELMLTNVTDPNLWDDTEAFKTSDRHGLLKTWALQLAWCLTNGTSRSTPTFHRRTSLRHPENRGRLTCNAPEASPGRRPHPSVSSSEREKDS